MNPIRTLRAAVALAPLALLAPTLRAQTAPEAGWREVMRGDDGTTVSVDSAHVSRTSRSGFIVRTAVRFPQPMQLESGAPIDREVDLEELDCGKTRIRGVESQLLFDTATVRRVLLSRRWAPVEENRLPLFEARCAWLVDSFASAAPAEYEAEEVEKGPELVNRREVARELSRVYPPALRHAGVSGTLTLRMRVLEDGSVDDPTITILDATHPGFGESAVQAVRRMRFRPGRTAQGPVATWVVLPVLFWFRQSFDVSFPGMDAGSPGNRPLPPEIPPSLRP